MNGIVGMSQILSKSELSEDQIKNVDIIKSSGEHLIRVIEDLLRYQKLESIDFALNLEPVQAKA